MGAIESEVIFVDNHHSCPPTVYRSLWDLLCNQLFAHRPSDLDPEESFPGVKIWHEGVISMTKSTEPYTFTLDTDAEEGPRPSDIIFYKKKFYIIKAVEQSGDVYTCTGCVRIEESIVGSYAALLELNTLLKNAESERTEAEDGRSSAEQARVQQANTDHERAGDDHDDVTEAIESANDAAQRADEARERLNSMGAVMMNDGNPYSSSDSAETEAATSQYAGNTEISVLMYRFSGLQEEIVPEITPPKALTPNEEIGTGIPQEETGIGIITLQDGIGTGIIIQSIYQTSGGTNKCTQLLLLAGKTYKRIINLGSIDPNTGYFRVVGVGAWSEKNYYSIPSTGIPASDIADGVIPDVSQFVTKSVSDLANYYLKNEIYTKDEVVALIGAIQQFHYEVYASLPETGTGNVLYLIGPTGTGSDRYEEYVYANGVFTKIGDTSIDLSGYVKSADIPIEKGSGANSVQQKGTGAIASGPQSTAFGKETKAYEPYSHAEGDHSQASGIASHAEGSSQAHKDYSHSEGASTDCHGDAGHTEGAATSVAGDYAHAEGDGAGSNEITIVSINGNVFALSSVDGLTTDSVLKYDEFYYRILSINTSENTVTVDKPIVVSTWDTGTREKYGVAFGIASHVEGRHGVAFGTNAHVEGNENVADGNASHAEGYNTRTRNNNEHAEGQYNKSNPGTIHSVGIGTSESTRKNAFEIMQNGDTYLKGIGGYEGDNLNVVGVQTLQQEINKKYTKPSTGIPETDLKQDVQDLLGRAGNSVAVKLAELDGNGVIFSPSLEPFILVAMNTNDIAVYHVSASTSLTPEANIIRLVYSSASSLLKFYYYDDNVVAWSDGEVSLYYCNLSGLYYDFEFFDGSLQRLEEDGVLLPIEEFATKSDLTAKYEKPSAGIPKSDLASSVQSSLNKADTAYQKPSNGIPDTDMTESVRRCLELADSSATLNRFVIEGGHGLKFVASANSYLVRIGDEGEESVYLISCGDDYTNTQVTVLTHSAISDVSFYICSDTSLLIWASSAYRFSIISLRENGAIGSEIIDEMPEDVEEIVPGTYATDLDLADKQDIISDLSTIRSGAAAGASAVQPSAIANMESTDNKTTSISSESTDQQYPSAKAVYDFVTDTLGDIETLLAAI